MKSIHRFFVDEIKKRYEDKELIHQLKDVFRMEKGSEIILFCGDGFEHEAKIELLSKKEVVLQIGEKTIKEEKAGLHLYISIIKKDKFELAISKAVELGVSSITPVKADRSQYDEINIERLNKIIKEAAEQSGRVTIPKLNNVIKVDDVPDVIVLDVEGESIKNVLKLDSILVGPEGGWSDREKEMFDKTYSLPTNTLRAETAVIAGLVALLVNKN